MPFDPSKPFEAIEKQGFDPSKPFDQMPQPDAVAVTTAKERPGRDIGAGESGFRGAIDSLTMGFGDEVGGAMEALGSLVGIRGIGSPNLKDIRLETDTEDEQSFKEVYEAMRDRRRSLDKSAEEQNPKSYMGGQFAGGVASVPMGGALLKGASAIPSIAKGAGAAGKFLTSGGKVAQAVKIGGVQGAGYGAGASEAEDIGGVIFDAEKGALLGAGGGAVLTKGGDIAAKGVQALGRLIGKVNPYKTSVEVLSNFAFDLPPKYTEELLRNPKVKNARTMDELSDIVVSTTKRIRKDLAQEDTIAWNMLSDTPVVSKAALADSVEAYKNSLNLTDLPGDRAAARKIDSLISTVEKWESDLSEKDLKFLVQRIDKDTDWNAKDLAMANEAMQSLRTGFDSYIKGNDAYKKQMVKVRDLTESFNFLQKKMGLQKEGGDFAPQTTKTKLKAMFDAQGEIKNKYIKDRLGKVNPDLVDEVRARSILDRTEGGVTQGSRNVLAGGLVGGASTGPVGAVLGASLGYMKDKYGRKVGKELIDRNRNKINQRSKMFEDFGAKIQSKAEPFATAERTSAQAKLQSGFTAATVPNLIADKIGKQQGDFSEQEKRAVTKVYIMKQKNPNLSEEQIEEVLKGSIPGYSRKKAAEDFTGNTQSMD